MYGSNKSSASKIIARILTMALMILVAYWLTSLPLVIGTQESSEFQVEIQKSDMSGGQLLNEALVAIEEYDTLENNYQNGGRTDD